MQDEFLRRKKQQFLKKDKSFIGNVDDRIKSLIEAFNANDDFYTTSSCSGRFVLIKGKREKERGLFLWVSHKRTSADELKMEISKAVKEYGGKVYFKMEPAILVVVCRDIKKAQRLVEDARHKGWKRSGIFETGKRIVVELMCTEKLELIVGEKGRVLVDDDYLKVLAREGNERLERTWEKIERLRNLF